MREDPEEWLLAMEKLRSCDDDRWFRRETMSEQEREILLKLVASRTLMPIRFHFLDVSPGITRRLLLALDMLRVELLPEWYRATDIELRYIEILEIRASEYSVLSVAFSDYSNILHDFENVSKETNSENDLKILEERSNNLDYEYRLED